MLRDFIKRDSKICWEIKLLRKNAEKKNHGIPEKNRNKAENCWEKRWLTKELKMGISKSIKNIFGKTKKKKDDVAIGGVTTGGVATHSDAVKSPKTKPKNRNRVRLSKISMLWQNYC